MLDFRSTLLIVVERRNDWGWGWPAENREMGGHRSYHHQTSTRERVLSRSLKIQIRASVGSRTGDDGFPLSWWICSIFSLIPLWLWLKGRVCFNRWIREPGCFIQSRSSWWVSSVYALSSDLESWFTPSIKVRCGKPFLLRKNKQELDPERTQCREWI